MSRFVYSIVRVLYFASTACLAVSVLAHLWSFLPLPPPSEDVFIVLLVSAIAFSIPLVIIHYTNPDAREILRNSPLIITPRTSYHVLVAETRNAPGWMRIVYYALVTYVLFNAVVTEVLDTYGATNTMIVFRFTSSGCMFYFYYSSLVLYSRMRELKHRLNTQADTDEN